MTNSPSARSMAETRRSVWISTLRSWQRSRSALRTVRALSVVGKSLPVDSRLSSTPMPANHSMVRSTDQAASTFLMMRRLPKKSAAVTAACVTLHRPPPDTRILAPSVFAPSRRTIRRPPLRSPEAIAAARPAAPPPTYTRSAESIERTIEESDHTGSVSDGSSPASAFRWPVGDFRWKRPPPATAPTDEEVLRLLLGHGDRIRRVTRHLYRHGHPS